jgi:hypothetical protein
MTSVVRQALYGIAARRTSVRRAVPCEQEISLQSLDAGGTPLPLPLQNIERLEFIHKVPLKIFNPLNLGSKVLILLEIGTSSYVKEPAPEARAPCGGDNNPNLSA